MAQEIQNLRMRPCEVFFNEVTLGHTNGGAEVEIVREFQDMKVDKYGNTPVDKVLIGNRLRVTVRMAEIVVSILKNAIPEAVYTQGNGDNKLGFGRGAGHKLSQYARLLRLHPLDLASSNRNEDLYVFKAVSVENTSLNYKADEQQVVEVVFESLVDESQVEGTLLGRFGDIDIS